MTVRADGSRPHWLPAYVGVGSNLESPADQVRAALDELARLPGTHLALRSPLYASPPMGPPDQPEYVNAVAGLLTTLDPHALLAGLQDIERRMGRHRELRWGPRIIDLDLLVYGAERIDADDLSVPHPGIAERIFVLQPLADVAPDLEIPGIGRVRSLLARLDGATIRRL